MYGVGPKELGGPMTHHFAEARNVLITPAEKESILPLLKIPIGQCP
jgi:hypothetical protein